jgi:hypothetical protein
LGSIYYPAILSHSDPENGKIPREKKKSVGRHFHGSSHPELAMRQPRKIEWHMLTWFLSRINGHMCSQHRKLTFLRGDVEGTAWIVTAIDAWWPS